MARKIWDIDLAISAPQIFLVEHFNDKNAVLCVVDLGKLHFTNREPNTGIKTSIATNNEEDDEGMHLKLWGNHYMVGSTKNELKLFLPHIQNASLT